MVHWSILWFTGVYYSSLEYTIVHWSILWFTVIHYGSLEYTVIYCNILQFTCVLFSLYMIYYSVTVM